MPRTRPAPGPPANRLLALLPPPEYERLTPLLQAVALPANQVLFRTRSPIDFVYFLSTGVASAMTRMEDGEAIEVATIGNEGMVGLTAFVGGETSPNEVVVQIPGDGLRMSVEALRNECGGDGPLRRLLARYHTAYSTQVSYAVACNGLHKIEQRCSRWLLMSLDRVGTAAVPLTHEFLAIMLGVQRSSVTEVLQSLRDRGLVRLNRGKITVVDRPGLEAAACECYGAVRGEFARLFG